MSKRKINLPKYSHEELSAFGRKGGINSGKVRRIKALKRNALLCALNMKLPDKILKSITEKDETLATILNKDETLLELWYKKALIQNLFITDSKLFKELNKIIELETEREEKENTKKVEL